MSAADDFPLGGITESVTVPRELVGAVVLRLTSCEHTHVFIVDRSGTTGPRDYTRIGMSETGLRCITEVLQSTSL